MKAKEPAYVRPIHSAPRRLPRSEIIKRQHAEARRVLEAAGYVLTDSHETPAGSLTFGFPEAPADKLDYTAQQQYAVAVNRLLKDNGLLGVNRCFIGGTLTESWPAVITK